MQAFKLTKLIIIAVMNLFDNISYPRNR